MSKTDKNEALVFSGIFILLVIGIFVLSISADMSNNLTPQDVIASTVIITDGHGHGSGLYLGNGIILTAWHCLGIPNAYIIDANGNQYSILDEIEVGDWTEDIGFIKINPKADIPAWTKFGKTPSVGDKVFICGTPLEQVLFANFTTGTVTKVEVDIPGWWDDATICDATALPGNSGGGVFDENFNLIGILVGGFIGYDGVSICEPIEDILRQMELEL